MDWLSHSVARRFNYFSFEDAFHIERRERGGREREEGREREREKERERKRG